MWNGAPGSSTASPFASASAKGSTVVNAPSEVACMCAKSSTGRTQPQRLEISTNTSHAPHAAPAPPPYPPAPNGPPPFFLPQPRPQLAELLDHRVQRVLARAAEQEAGMEV